MTPSANQLLLQQALVPGGILVFSAEHPIYTAPLQQGWQVNEQSLRCCLMTPSANQLLTRSPSC
jgi:hypothetical protein